MARISGKFSLPVTMDENPYASPREVADDFDASPDIDVEGNYLVVRSKVVLPQRCIITNEAATSKDRCVQRFQWAPPYRLVLRIRKCKLTYYVNRKHRMKKYRIRTIASFLLLLLGWPLLGSFVLCFLPLFLVAIFWLPLAGLEVKSEERGRFWISGFGEEFLTACKQEFSKY